MITPGDQITKFRLREPHRARLLETPPRWGHAGLSEVTFYRTYSRLRPDGGQESWNDCVVRVIEGMFSILRTHAAQNRIPWREDRGQRLALEAAERMLAFKWTPPGRGLWMMGTDYVWSRGAAALNNCGFVSTKDLSEADPEASVGPFRFLMDMSMLGVGTGFDTRGAGKIGIRGTQGAPVTHRVADSREGWVEVVAETLRAHLFGGPQVVPDVQDVRLLGAKLNGFGGVASGPGPLLQGLRGIELLLGQRRGSALDSVLITDIMNIIGKIVVAGNIRRTAEIAFGEPDDVAFRTMKNWDDHPEATGNAAPSELALESPEDHARYEAHKFTPADGVTTEIAEKYADRPWAVKFGGWRWASNNSIFARTGMDYHELNDPIFRSGEPGLAWLDLMRSHGRLKDPENNRDHRVMGGNPCFAGDTLIGVADGRRAVRIDELAADGRDVPVYSRSGDGDVEIRMARAPRLTRRGAELVEVVLDDGSSVRVTPDHKFELLNGEARAAQDLVAGDSLPRFQTEVDVNGYVGVRTKTLDMHHRPHAEHRMIARFHDPEGYEAAVGRAREQGCAETTGYHLTRGVIAHHKDENTLNNAPSNIVWVTMPEHNTLHTTGRVLTDEARGKISEAMLRNHAMPGFTDRQRAGYTEAGRQSLSVKMTEQRAQWSRERVAAEAAATDLRHEVSEDGTRLYALKNCIICGQEMRLPWRQRAGVFCSRSCSSRSEEHVQSRRAGQRRAFDEKLRKNLHVQVSALKDLEAQLGRAPLKKEWEAEARARGATVKFSAGNSQNPNIMSSYGALREYAAVYNHRVAEVRKVPGLHDVYNLTVDENYTVAVVTSGSDDLAERSGILVRQCLEQSLESYELCCLVENYPSHAEAPQPRSAYDTEADYTAARYWDFQRTLKFSYLYAKSVTLLGTHVEETNEIIARNRRIGSSMSGIADTVAQIGRSRFFTDWCERGYSYVGYLDKKYSDWLGVRESVKRTSVKPSGTVTLLAGVFGPGAHFPKPTGYRLMRLARGSEVAAALVAARYRVEPAVTDPTGTVVAYFPWLLPEGTLTEDEVGVWEQVKMAASLQHWWADNQVSYTATFAAEEAERGEIGRVLEAFDGELKGISFLQKSTGSYAQMPFTTAPRAEVEAYAATLLPLSLSGRKTHEQVDSFCDGAACTIVRTPPAASAAIEGAAASAA